MALPKAVREQAERAEAIQNQIAGVEPVVNPDDDPAPASDQVDWEKRFKGLAKSHQKTVTDLRDSNDQLSTEVGELRKLVEKATIKPDEPAAQAAMFTPEEVEEYGQDFLDMVTRVAEAKAAGSSTVAEDLKALQARLDGVIHLAVKSDEQKFYEALDKAVPDWESINVEDEFHVWLGQEMPMTGQERQVFLAKAQQKFDAKTVIGFFLAWKAQSGDDVSVYPDTTTTSSELPREGDDDKAIISKAAVKQFYTDCSTGKYKGQDELKRQIESKIFRATQEGRIR